MEWWVHVLMHKRWFLGRIHTAHHKDGVSAGWLYEFLAYAGGAIPGGLVMLGLGYASGFLWAGIGGLTGSILFAAFAAYSHQVQHDWPELVFWMNPPVHAVHHQKQLWRSNFGISLDIWDRIMGTYQKLEWTPNPERQRRRRNVLDYLRITWF
jgi:sterol desaturase/sphingolipid hydroxylase (fatty acid hydroxylase superfamily)